LLRIAKRGIATVCCPSVCPSLLICGHIGWVTLKVIILIIIILIIIVIINCAVLLAMARVSYNVFMSTAARDVNEARMLRERERGQRCEDENETKIIFRGREREQHYENENETSETAVTPGIVRKRCILDTKLLWDGNRKPYASYRMVSLSMTLSDP